MTHVLRVTAVALIVLAAPLASSASAHEFVASKIGKGKVRSTTAQVFKTAAGDVECAKASGNFEVTALKGETLEVPKLAYTECTGFGVAVSVSAGDYEFKASGTVSFKKSLAISPEGLGCEIVFGMKGNSGLEKVSYADSVGKLRIAEELTGLAYTGTGGACGGTSSGGRYDGDLEVELEGGTIEWKR